MMISILSAVLVIGVLIFIHELGHFFVAKASGVAVERFSLGFGPPILTFKRGETEYCLSSIPFGGYVKMLGEDPSQEISPSQYHRSFSHKPLFVKAAIVAAGPLANVILAVVTFFFVYALAGIPYLVPEIGEVSKGSPAELAGIQKGDIIYKVSDTEIKTWNDFSEAILKWQPGHEPLSIIVKRGEEFVAVKVTPTIKEVKNIFGESVRRPVIGVTVSGRVELEKANPFKAFIKSLEQTIYVSKLFFVTIVKLIQGIIPFSTVGGPIMIAQMAGQQAQAGFFPLLNFMALLSLNLAIINLLPLPALDGGHLVIFAIEAVTRRRIKEKAIEWIQRIGFALIIILMILVFYNDIVRIFPWIPEIFRLPGEQPK